MSPDLEAARLAAVSALGRQAEKILTRLEAAGLVVVRTTEVQAGQPQTLEGVRVQLREPWDGVAPIQVQDADGESVVLTVVPGAVAAVREAALLQQVTGVACSLSLDAHGYVTAAWTETD